MYFCPDGDCECWCGVSEETPEAPTQGINWNTDPEWHAYIAGYESVIAAIAAKYCSDDRDLQEDCRQEARLALLTVFPERVNGYAAYIAGELSEDAWFKNLSRYCRNAIRNSILSYLTSWKTGNWNVGRSRTIIDKVTGERTKVYQPARFSSLDALTEDSGMQIDEQGQITWDRVSEAGLPDE